MSIFTLLNTFVASAGVAALIRIHIVIFELFSPKLILLVISLYHDSTQCRV